MRRKARMEHEGDFPPVDIFICTYGRTARDPREVSSDRAWHWTIQMPPSGFLDDTRRKMAPRILVKRSARAYVTPGQQTEDRQGGKPQTTVLRSRQAQTNAPAQSWCWMRILLPRPDFLKRTVGLLSNPDVGRGSDNRSSITIPIRSSTICWPRKVGVDDQTLLFRRISAGQGCVGMRVLCRDNPFVVRRDRLTEIGGFPSQAISEDINLTYTMLANGYQDLVAERETQHRLIGRGNTRIHHAKGPAGALERFQVALLSRRAVVWIGIYDHPKMALPARRV